MAIPKDDFVDLRDGAEGCIAFCNEFIHVPIYPKGSVIPEWVLLGDLPSDTIDGDRSYQTIWRAQQEILREALRMEDGRFVYRLLVFCWMRGEGKSLLVCLVLLWKFFMWDQQKIMLGANSRDQVKFVHFDIMRDIVINSPKLLEWIGGKKNILEKEIRKKDDKGNIVSLIRSISSFSGIVSNITAYSFSEIFDMKNPKFFVQLDGSIRNIPNAFGVIDSTVSEKTHVLYQLYTQALKRETKGVFYSYRYSERGLPEDYWNPNMTKDQLDDYRMKFPFGEFERYFLNLWSAGKEAVFTDQMIEEISYIGSNGGKLNHGEMSEILERKHKLLDVMRDSKGKGFGERVDTTTDQIIEIDQQFDHVVDIYSLVDGYGLPQMATMEDLDKLSDMFDTDWAVLAGTDFGDPYAARGVARTIMVVVAKGLAGSRTDPYLGYSTAPKYLYFVLHVVNAADHSLDAIKKELEEAGNEFDGLDTLCSERYGAWDVQGWCDERDIKFEPVFPTYDRQKEAFKEVLISVKEGRFKSPPTKIHGSKKEDITREEFTAFNHVLKVTDQGNERGWFGSVEKFEKYGIQDDFMFALGWCMYGGRHLSTDDFRIRKASSDFGYFVQNMDTVGKYA
jgi:hypothetical protein